MVQAKSFQFRQTHHDDIGILIEYVKFIAGWACTNCQSVDCKIRISLTNFVTTPVVISKSSDAKKGKEMWFSLV